eukprot:TRINITY_DN40436_c0_g1_i1.p1 TRINITY_DN40436_c0_g1~~TRINITY_DN40436_c0_g1_i1.p1  ORF type:complete len:71 (+),score=2.35 TRINITY_DN40436_c0_g1_i1:55-267(+)
MLKNFKLKKTFSKKFKDDDKEKNFDGIIKKKEEKEVEYREFNNINDSPPVSVRNWLNVKITKLEGKNINQ